MSYINRTGTLSLRFARSGTRGEKTQQVITGPCTSYINRTGTLSLRFARSGTRAAKDAAQGPAAQMPLYDRYMTHGRGIKLYLGSCSVV